MTSSKPPLRSVPPPQGGAARPNNAYARFIPREELDNFAAWTPDTFGGFGGGPGSAPAQPTPHQSGVRAPAPPPVTEPPAAAAPAEPDIADVIEALQARAQEARQQGYQEGYRDGLEALEAAKRQFAQQISAQMAQIAAAFQDQLGGLETRMAESLVTTAVTLARQVVRSELAQRPDCVVQVAQQAVAAVMVTAKHLVLRLNPEDVVLVEMGAADTLRTRDVMLQPDPAIERGGCIVDSDLGRVDARIESRWAQAAAVFDVPLPWHSPAEARVPAAAAAAVPQADDDSQDPAADLT